MVKNKDLFTTNQEIHNINTRCNINLHPPICNLTLFQKGVQFSGIKLFNHLPLNIKSLSNEINLFKPASKRFLLLHSFYSGVFRSILITGTTNAYGIGLLVSTQTTLNSKKNNVMYLQYTLISTIV